MLVVEHATDCPPALLGQWLTEAGLRARRAPAVRRRRPARPRGVRRVLVLGGPMGALDDESAPWLPRVRERVREAVRGRRAHARASAWATSWSRSRSAAPSPATRPASSSGCSSSAGPRPPRTTSCSARWPARAAACSGTTTSSPRCPPAPRCWRPRRSGEVQAVRFAPAVWGVQLHPEVDDAVLAPWAAADRGTHQAQGIDQEALLRAVDEARAELDAAWRPLAAPFAALARAAAVSRADDDAARAPPRDAGPAGLPGRRAALAHLAALGEAATRCWPCSPAPPTPTWRWPAWSGWPRGRTTGPRCCASSSTTRAPRCGCSRVLGASEALATTWCATPSTGAS